MNKEDVSNMCQLNRARSRFKHAFTCFDYPERTTFDDIELLSYVMSLVKIDLASSAKLNAVYDNEWHQFLFPESFDWKGNLIVSLKDTGEEKEFTLNEQTYISTWKPKSLLKSFFDIRKTGFKQNGNHEAYYYKELDLLHVYNGLHSSLAGSMSSGVVKAKVVSIEHLFDMLETDGVYWYCYQSIKDDKRLRGKVINFRLAFLFELARIKYELEKYGKTDRL
ncbi:DUF6710 family protein [Streptococcus sp. zg-JUN1979]|uniref:DUF6710 family protein n=1 Tax=Streptococcus sp. zg-JUN1979 TaxID=3391450 RepID=UPI0039A44D5D